MATFGFMLIGAIFGGILSLLLVVFYLLRSEATLRDGAAEIVEILKERISGRRRVAPGEAAVRSPEQEQRLRVLQEEAKILQRLLEQEKVAREAADTARLAVETQRTELQARLARSAEQLAELESRLTAGFSDTQRVQTDLAESSRIMAEMAQQIRDLQTELDVGRSGSAVLAEQVLRLEDEKARLHRRLTQLISTGAAGALT
jgi:chromosome segregation ATPase